MNLIQLSRPRIMVLAGTVTEVNLASGTVKIRGFCPQIQMDKDCLLRADRNQIANLELKQGDRIMATVKPSIGLITLQDGGYDGTDVFRASVYHIRFTGAFDFAPRGEQSEQHVFRGNICNARPVSGGRTAMVLEWFKESQSEKRNLIMLGPPPDTSDPVIVTTGGAIDTQKYKVYPVARIDL